jgi:hypothetical protein
MPAIYVYPDRAALSCLPSDTNDSVAELGISRFTRSRQIDSSAASPTRAPDSIIRVQQRCHFEGYEYLGALFRAYESKPQILDDFIKILDNMNEATLKPASHSD